ncbi:MAG: ATP-binding cassette domain-containing protein [Verrucomicrobiae bacterium]|nr:ATP-binding cassette domain-containing protein [Verrucomicrobiae bacterium]
MSDSYDAEQPELPLVSLRNISLAQGGRIFLRRLSWDIYAGDHWVVRGDNGTGKTTLLRVLSGELWPAPGHDERRLFGFAGELDSSPLSAEGRFSYVGPELQNLPVRQESNLTGLEMIASGLEDTVYLHKDLSPKEAKRLKRIVRLLGIKRLVGKLFVELSQGEKRKILLARALMKDPDIILLDEFTDGLDQESVTEVEGLLADAASEMRATIILTSHREDMPLSQWWRSLELGEGTGWEINPGQFKPKPLKEIFAGFKERKSPPPPPEEPKPIATVEGAVSIGGTTILKKVDWTIYTGQHWTIGGPNGSGKTTLLRAIYGDFVSSGKQEWFGRDTVTVQEARRRIGFFHPEMHALFPEELSGARIILSGFHDTIGQVSAPSDREKLLTVRIARKLGIEDLLRKRFGELSYGQTRKLLLARALVKAPRLLVLDEPTDGLDAASRELFWNEVQWQMERGTTVVVASHRRDDVPRWIEWGLDLRGGKIERWLRRKV